MQPKLIIAIHGPKHVGKSYLAEALRGIAEAKGFTVQRASFATPIKNALYEMGWNGQKDKKGRRALQLLGTEIGRAINPNIWVDRLAQSLHGEVVIIDDLRFKNEYTWCVLEDALTIKLRHPPMSKARFKQAFDWHASERGIQMPFDFDITNHHNSENFKCLYQFVEEQLSRLPRQVMQRDLQFNLERTSSCSLSGQSKPAEETPKA